MPAADRDAADAGMPPTRQVRVEALEDTVLV